MAYPSVTKLRKLLKQHGFALKTTKVRGHDGDDHIWTCVTHVESGHEWGRTCANAFGEPRYACWVLLEVIVDENLALFNDALGDLRRDIRVLGDLRGLTEGGNDRAMKKRRLVVAKKLELKLNMNLLPDGAVVICEAPAKDSLHVLCAWRQNEYVVWSVGLDGSVNHGSYVGYGRGCFEASSQLDALKRAIEILEERAYGRKGE